MARIELLGGAYTARSLIAAAQREVNTFPEVNPAGASQAPVKVTHYQRPGLVQRSTVPSATTVRCQYRTTTGKLYEVIGSGVYYTDSALTRTALGAIAPGSGQVKMADNGVVAVIVDGSSRGWWIDLSTNVMLEIFDAAFYGSNFVCYSDTYLIFNRPGSQQFYLSPPNWNGATAFDPLDIAAKVTGADDLAGIAVVKGDIWLIGKLSTQVSSDVGGVDFAFAPVPGVYMDQGTVAVYSIVQTDLSAFWLSQDTEGHGIFLEGSNYSATRISTHAIEQEIQKYGDLSDCIGMSYQQDGHSFIQWTFPSADKTWVYDRASEMWHERTWTDSDGIEHRHRANCMAFCYGLNFCGDWQNGKLYEQSLTTYTDDGGPIVFRRGFPHLVNDGKRVSYNAFTLDMQCGSVEGVLLTDPPLVSLRWSDTHGYSFGDPIVQSMGATGQYLRQINFNRLGQARDRVFEVFWSAPAPTALNGAWVQVTPMGT